MAQSLEYEIIAWPVAADEKRFVVLFDASFDPKGERNQLGRLVCVCSKLLNQGSDDKVSIGIWKSQKLDKSKTASSPNYTETQAGVRALADLRWYKALVDSLT